MATAQQSTAQAVSLVLSNQATPVNIANIASSSTSAQGTSALLTAAATMESFASFLIKTNPLLAPLIGSLSLSNDIYKARAEIKENGSVSTQTTLAIIADGAALAGMLALEAESAPMTAESQGQV